MVAVVVVVVAVVGLIALLSGKKKQTPNPVPPLTGPEKPAASTTEAAVPSRPPAPPVSPSLRDEAKTIVSQAKSLSEEAEKLYKEAVEAHHEGNDDLWQAKLKEAGEKLYRIQTMWNDFIVKMPSNADWDEEEVANEYFGREGDLITRYTNRLQDIHKQRR